MTVSDQDLLSQRFEAHRERLAGVAYRMLGTRHEAEDAVQEVWLRLRGTDAGAIDNLGGWLTTVTGRVCLDVLRRRAARREVPVHTVTEAAVAEAAGAETAGAGAGDPGDQALVADSVGRALQVVLDTLAPAERLAFVLHDLFAVPFEEIAPIVGRTPVATRQLASRARRRVQADPAVPVEAAAARGEVVAAFLAAAHEGEFARLLQLLDPDVVLRADAVAVAMAADRAGAGAPALRREVRGADAVSRLFAGGARAARLALVDGVAGAVVSAGGRPMVAFDFTLRDGRVVGIDLMADPETLAVLDLAQPPPAAPGDRGLRGGRQP